MKLSYPSLEFDQAVAEVCHGRMDEDLARALNELLCEDSAARDEYLVRAALHARLASDSELFAAPPTALEQPSSRSKDRRGFEESLRTSPDVGSWKRRCAWAAAIATVAVPLWVLLWGGRSREAESQPAEIQGATTMAVAMLDRAVEAQWGGTNVAPQLGDPLDPGLLRLDSGLAQVLFYNGARVVIEGPAEFRLVDSGAMVFGKGRLTAEIAPQAANFQVSTPHANLRDIGSAVPPVVAPIPMRSGDADGNLGTAFGLEVTSAATELHVFEGRVELGPLNIGSLRELEDRTAATVENDSGLRPIVMDAWKFASLFELQRRSVAAEASRYEHWQESGERLNGDPSLLVRLDFENQPRDDWRLPNACTRGGSITDGTVIGCQWTNGRWPGKQALAFQSVNDRVRLSVPGEYDSLTLAMWVRVQGLDRIINSLFMSDGFAPGTVHWSIRNDGVMGLTLIGEGRGNYVLATTPPVLTLNRLGMWIHLAVVVDGPGGRAVQYLNGTPVADQSHQIAPPYTIGESELGNWNAEGFPGNDPFLIRNFSGAMDEFCLFGRALEADQIRELYRRGKPQPDSMAGR